MCDTCGCGIPEEGVTIRKPGGVQEEHAHAHGHNHPHEHKSEHQRSILVEQDVLAKNNLIAERNRGYFEAKGVFTLNLVSSPGSGKTTLLERTVSDLKEKLEFAVIEGDQQSMQDANRIEKTGVPVVQVNTGTGCHLDASMINQAIKELKPQDGSVLMIENVGNLVCPALFDLGEAYKVVIISVTEGEDKPLKYPFMFDVAHICLINKMDLLPYVDFSLDKCKEYALRVNHHLEFFEFSAKTGEGLEKWYDWIRKEAESLFSTKVSGV